MYGVHDLQLAGNFISFLSAGRHFVLKKVRLTTFGGHK